MNPEILAAVDRAIKETGVERYRWLAFDQPDESERRKWQEWLLAGRPAQPGPSVATMAAGVVQAAANVAVDLITGRPVRADGLEVERRLQICGECEHYDAARAKCARCGCSMPLKARLSGSHCPLSPPKW